jgi:hypothetical protein
LFFISLIFWNKYYINLLTSFINYLFFTLEYNNELNEKINKEKFDTNQIIKLLNAIERYSDNWDEILKVIINFYFLYLLNLIKYLNQIKN